MPLEPGIFVIDDNGEVCASLCWLLESAGHQARAFASAEEFLDACEPHRPSCLILDIHMPGMSGIELQSRLKALGMEAHIIFLTGHANVKTAVQAMREGAVDLFEKPVDEQTLLRRVQQVIEELKSRLPTIQQHAVLTARLALLTPREREVLDLVVAGKRTKEVAWQLGLSTKTVDAHRANIMTKMRVRSVAELVAAVAEIR